MQPNTTVIMKPLLPMLAGVWFIAVQRTRQRVVFMINCVCMSSCRWSPSAWGDSAPSDKRPPAGRVRHSVGWYPAPGRASRVGGRADARQATDFCVHTSVNQGEATKPSWHIHLLPFTDSQLPASYSTHSCSRWPWLLTAPWLPICSVVYLFISIQSGSCYQG